MNTHIPFYHSKMILYPTSMIKSNMELNFLVFAKIILVEIEMELRTGNSDVIVVLTLSKAWSILIALFIYNCRYDGNTVLGHRLYREVNKSDPKSKAKGKGCLAPPLAGFKWETLATNLEEFRKVAVRSHLLLLLLLLYFEDKNPHLSCF